MFPRNRAPGESTMIMQPPAAVALTYDASKDEAPIVVAKGYGRVAELIIERAREHGLYVHAAPDLVNLLMHVDLDQRIPPQLYVAVAEVLSWIYIIEARASDERLKNC